MLLIFLIGVALTNTFGRMVGDQRQGWALFAAMAVMFVAGLAIIYASEAAPNAALSSFGLDQAAGLCKPAATWKARRCASASGNPRCSRR